MRFGPWHPIEAAPAAAPDAPGVLQSRADGLLEYPRGKSAMMLYGCSDASLRAHLAGGGAADLARAAAAGARWVRFGETAEAGAALERLLRDFTERFGAPPVANSPRATDG